MQSSHAYESARYHTKQSTSAMGTWEFLIAAFLSAVFLAYKFFTRNFDYWQRRGVPFPPPQLLFGNVKKQLLFQVSQAESLQEVYHQLDGHPFGGYFEANNPVLLLRDPEIIKQMFVKDFWHFPDRGMTFDEKRDPLTGHLFNIEGLRWRNLRLKLTPTFTSGKMKSMFTLIDDCAQRMLKTVATALGPSGQVELDVRDTCCSYTIDVIGVCAFGLRANALDDPHSEFRRMGRITQVPPGARLRRTLRALAPGLLTSLRPRVFSDQVNAFFRDLVTSAIAHRAANPIAERRTDFMQLLLDLRDHGRVQEDIPDEALKKEEGEDYERALRQGPIHAGHSIHKGVEHVELTEDQVAAQVFLFFFAGFETSSLTMSYTLYELARQPHIQDKLREEIKEVLGRHDNKITYLSVQEMTYLGQVIQETLRLYPPVANIPRVCRKSYTIPGSELLIEEGTRIMVPVFAIQRDPKNYPDPERYDPDRFSPQQQKQRNPFLHLPFGEGPRVCIGSRFGLLQVKVGIATLITKFQFQVSSNTPVPLKFNTDAAATSPAGRVSLKVSLSSP